MKRAEKALCRQLKETGAALAAAQVGFQQTADRDLMEYYLYEISALRARHTWLLRQLREG